MPLLLVQSLQATGLLSSLLMSPEDTSSAAVTRARSYFLACAVVGNTLTFGVGPAQLKGHEEDSPEDSGRETYPNGKRANFLRHRVRWQENNDLRDPRQESEGDSETDDTECGRQGTHRGENNGNEGVGPRTERSPLLPSSLARHRPNLRKRIHGRRRQSFQKLPAILRRLYIAIKHFVNPPFIGAVYV